MSKRIGRRGWRWGTWIALGWCAVLAGCGRPAAAPSGQQTTDLATVAVVQPERRSLQVVIEQPGCLEPYEETQLFARISGYVSRVHVDIGQSVQAEQVLAEIAVPDLQEEANLKRAQLKQAQAEVEQAKIALAAAEANIAAAEAALSEAQAQLQRWQSELRRIEKLVLSGSLDAQTRDEVAYQYKAAQAHVLAREAAVQTARVQRDKAQADWLVANQRVAVAQADVRHCEALLSFAQIRAPFAGVITRRKVNTGDFVQPNAGRESWLFSVARCDPVRVVIYVPESEAALVQPGSPVTFWVKALQEAPFTGKITRTSWALQTGTRTLRAEVDWPNPEGKFRPGMYVLAQISTQSPATFTLPSQAVIRRGDRGERREVFLVDHNRAVEVTVLTGRNDADSVEVLKWRKAGSTDPWKEFTGQEVVVANPAGLADGQPVRIQRP